MLILLLWTPPFLATATAKMSFFIDVSKLQRVDVQTPGGAAKLLLYPQNGGKGAIAAPILRSAWKFAEGDPCQENSR